MKTFYGTELSNPMMLGTAQYPSPAILEQAFRDSGARGCHGFVAPRIRGRANVLADDP